MKGGWHRACSECVHLLLLSVSCAIFSYLVDSQNYMKLNEEIKVTVDEIIEEELAIIQHPKLCMDFPDL